MTKITWAVGMKSVYYVFNELALEMTELFKRIHAIHIRTQNSEKRKIRNKTIRFRSVAEPSG